MTDKHEWQGRTGESWAAEWKRTDRSFAAVTERLLEASRDIAFSRVLDVGCGAGELSLALARGRPDIDVIGVDVSPQLVEVAEERGANRANVGFELADAAAWRPSREFRPDLVISRHGVMFFDDPPAAFRNIARVAADEAHLLFSCFRAPAENPFFADVARLLPPPDSPPDPHAPGPFAFADREYTAGILEAGGWTDLDFTPVDCAMVVGAGEDPLAEAVAYYLRIGPAARHAADLGEEARAEFAEVLRSFAADHLRDGIVALRAGIWIVSGRKS